MILIIVIETARRTTGMVFPLMILLSSLYVFLGHYIPGYWGHSFLNIESVFTHIYLTSDAVWGFMTGLSATVVASFIIFGSFLLSSGAGETMVDLAKRIAGKYVGGPAKVAVVSSAFFSMISDSPMANVATTGSFTIPMMKKLGYSNEFAGGVESVASTGGILTPPVMGATGFIMAEFLGISYTQVIIAAAIPAFLFYLSVFMGTHFQSVKLNLKPIPSSELPSYKNILVFSRMFNLVVPILTLLYTLFKGYSLFFVGTSAAVMVLVTFIFSDLNIKNIKSRLVKIPGFFERAGKAMLLIPAVLVSANIFLFMLNFTGLSLKFSQIVMSQGESFPIIYLLILIALLVMVLGCGLPVIAAYIMGVTVAIRGLSSLGIDPLAAHLFILYYSIIAGITPPFCPTVYVGAAIAQSDWLKTAWVSMKLAPTFYLMPFIFVFDNSLIMMGDTSVIIKNFITAAIGVILISGANMKYFITHNTFLESAGLLLAGLLMVIPGTYSDFIGILLGAIVIFVQTKRNKKVMV